MNRFIILGIILPLISLWVLFVSVNAGLNSDKERECAKFFNVYKCEWVLKPLMDE